MLKITVSEVTNVEKPETKKKTFKIKSLVGTNIVRLIIAMGENEEPITLDFDMSALSQEMHNVLAKFVASRRLVNSASGREGQEAVDRINTAWGALEAGTWHPQRHSSKKFL